MLNSQGNVVITQAELASMSPQAAEALLQDSQISVAAPGQNRVTITQAELASMSPQMAEAMLNDPLVSLADGNGGGSNTSGQNIATITQAELNSMSSQAAEAILSDPNVQLVGSGGSGINTSVQTSGRDVITNALNDINSMSGLDSILAAQDPYRILDSAEKEASFKSAKRDKNISDDDFKWLLVLTKGDENKAKEHVIKLTASHLRSLIITQKNFAGYEDELGKNEVYQNYLSNLYDIDEVVDEVYEDQYFGVPTTTVENVIKNRGIVGNFTEEELDLAGRYPFKTQKGVDNRDLAVELENYIAEKYDLARGDNVESNAFRHAILAALHKDDFGVDIATKFVNAHENTITNLDAARESAVMDLHNNAIGLSIDRPEGMSNKEFAEYVYAIIREDGYWLWSEDGGHIPEWAKNDIED